MVLPAGVGHQYAIYLDGFGEECVGMASKDRIDLRELDGQV